MASSDESRALGLVLAGSAGAQLAGWRVFDSLVPDPVDAVRRDIDITSAGVQLAGAATLCIPALRPVARWLNVGIHSLALALAVDSVRHPKRFRRSRTSHTRITLAPARIPVHVVAIALILWVTRAPRVPHRARGSNARGAGTRSPVGRPPAAPRGPAIDDETPESASASEM
jgi:uncharacterized membrane protein